MQIPLPASGMATVHVALGPANLPTQPVGSVAPLAVRLGQELLAEVLALDGPSGRALLSMAGRRFRAQVPPTFQEGQVVRLAVAQASSERLVLRVVPGTPSGAASPPGLDPSAVLAELDLPDSPELRAAVLALLERGQPLARETLLALRGAITGQPGQAAENARAAAALQALGLPPTARALELARAALTQGEVPIGDVLRDLLRAVHAAGGEPGLDSGGPEAGAPAGRAGTGADSPAGRLSGAPPGAGVDVPAGGRGGEPAGVAAGRLPGTLGRAMAGGQPGFPAGASGVAEMLGRLAAAAPDAAELRRVVELLVEGPEAKLAQAAQAQVPSPRSGAPAVVPGTAMTSPPDPLSAEGGESGEGLGGSRTGGPPQPGGAALARPEGELLPGGAALARQQGEVLLARPGATAGMEDARGALGAGGRTTGEGGFHQGQLQEQVHAGYLGTLRDPALPVEARSLLLRLVAAGQEVAARDLAGGPPAAPVAPVARVADTGSGVVQAVEAVPLPGAAPSPPASPPGSGEVWPPPLSPTEANGTPAGVPPVLGGRLPALPAAVAALAQALHDRLELQQLANAAALGAFGRAADRPAVPATAVPPAGALPPAPEAALAPPPPVASPGSFASPGPAGIPGLSAGTVGRPGGGADAGPLPLAPLHISVPLAIAGGQITTLELSVQREAASRRGPGEAPAEAVRARFSVHLARLGEVGADLHLAMGGRSVGLRCRLTAESGPVQAALAAAAADLEERLRRAGFQVDALDCISRDRPVAPPPAALRRVDVGA